MMTLRTATMNDWQLLLQWRNDAATRMNSHQSQAVPAADHRAWLKKVLEDADRQLFIAEWDGQPVGTVRADWVSTDHAWELSWTLAPEARGRSLGKIMVKMLADQLEGRLTAQVKVGNTASVKIAEHCGLVLVQQREGILYFASS